MFQFRRFPAYCYLIHKKLTEYCSAGFPHSDIHGSMPAFDSPWLFVDRYVLLRLPMPRHSPCALISLTFLELCVLCSLISQLDLIVVYFTLYSFLEKFKASNICLISLFPFHIYLYSVFKVHFWFNLNRKIQFKQIWWAWEDSNLRPHAYQACALTTWATSPFSYPGSVFSNLWWR